MFVDPAPHLIVPFAHCGGDECLKAVTSLKLKNLGHLLNGMSLIATDNGQADSLSPPHERVLARAMGLPASADGLIPWAAYEAHQTRQTHEAHKAQDAHGALGQAWAFVNPCHWAMGREHATLTDPATLDLTEEQSRTLLAAMQPYFATEGITLHYSQATRWLAQGEVFRNLPTASIDRVLGHNVDRWLPNSKAMKLLQNEMQMLLYTHPVNDERAASGQRSVNSFWLSGSGALDDLTTGKPQVVTAKNLMQAALGDDWAAYSQAWMQLDATLIAQFLARQKGGEAVRLSLCGESNAMTFGTTKSSLLSSIKQLLSPQHPINLLKQL